MIGDYKGDVRNKVVLALLQAYQDTLDYDGLKSILREAEFFEVSHIENLNPNHLMDFFSFKKLLSAQNCLLYRCDKLLFKIGKKFSFYLFPLGKQIEEIITEINELILTDWKVEIVKKTKNSITIRVQNCIFCSEIGVPCYFFKGFLVNSLEKTLPSDKKVIFMGQKENLNDPNHNDFFFKLKIKKKNIYKYRQ